MPRRAPACHQPDGQGLRKGTQADAAGYVYPPLWGPDSFNDGAGMHRLIASASYIRANMPLGTRYDAPALSVEDAWDVAAFINSQPRPPRARPRSRLSRSREETGRRAVPAVRAMRSRSTSIASGPSGRS